MALCEINIIEIFRKLNEIRYFTGDHQFLNPINNKGQAYIIGADTSDQLVIGNSTLLYYTSNTWKNVSFTSVSVIYSHSMNLQII